MCSKEVVVSGRTGSLEEGVDSGEEGVDSGEERVVSREERVVSREERVVSREERVVSRVEGVGSGEGMEAVSRHGRGCHWGECAPSQPGGQGQVQHKGQEAIREERREEAGEERQDEVQYKRGEGRRAMTGRKWAGEGSAMVVVMVGLYRTAWRAQPHLKVRKVMYMLCFCMT